MPPIASKPRSRLPARLLRHHLPIFAITALIIAGLYFTRPYDDVISRASFATAYPALALLAATLVPGPWNLFRSRLNPISTDLRRDLGIWAGLIGILHSAVGQCVHLRWRPWLYYLYGPWEHGHTLPLRHDLFGLANYTGAAAALVLIALLATSSDLALRALGTPRWKQIQRWNYAIFALAAVHSLAYQISEKQQLPWVTTVIICIAIALVFQIAGVILRRTTRRVPAIQQVQT